MRGLGVFFGRSNQRRLILAFAISIALHEAVAGLVPSHSVSPPLRYEIVTRARVLRIARRAIPSTAPHRTAVQHPAAPRILSHRQSIARAAPKARSGGSAIAHAPKLSTPIHTALSSRPVWDVASGRSTSSTSLVAAGTSAGAGNGSGLRGSGAGLPAGGNEPCGFVTFSDPHGSQYDSHTHGFWVDIRMSVHFADGSSQSMILNYPWYYASEAVNPWSDQNLKDPNFPTRFQPPPSDRIAGEPPLVQYVIAHSSPEGMTLLHDCPPNAPAPGT